MTWNLTVVGHITVTAHNQKEKNQKAMIIIISMPIEQVNLIQIQPVIIMVNGIKASIGTIDLIMMVIIIIRIQIQIPNLPATGLTIWIEIEIEIMKTTVRTTNETLQMDVLLDKSTKETTHWVMKATAMTFHPMGPSEKDRNILTTIVMTKVMPTKGMRNILTRKVLRNIRKRRKYTDNQSYDKSNTYQGNEKYFDQKSSEKHYSPENPDERFPGLCPSDHQSYEKSNAYKVNKKFTDQKSSEKGYTPECGKLPAIHPVNEKSPAHHQVNENSPAIDHDIQSRLTCDDYHSRDQAVYTTSSPKHKAIFPCVFL